MTLFLIVALSVWALLHLFVGWNWHRLGVAATWLWPSFVFLWASYPVARWREWHWLEYIAANWMGILFLQFALLLIAGVINLGGVYWPFLQRYAAFAAGILAGIALIQGHRPPVIRDYEVRVPGLTRDVQLVAISDLHLGSLLGQRWVADLKVAPIFVLLAIYLLYFVLGTVLEGIGMFLLTLPVIFPVIQALGYDPIWFGIVLVKLSGIASLSPPVGLVVFVVNGVRPDISVRDIFKGIWPFIFADTITLAILTAFPEIVTFIVEVSD